MITIPKHEKHKETVTQNAHKHQNITAKNKARKQTTKTSALFLLTKMLHTPKKQKKNVKRQKKMFHNGK